MPDFLEILQLRFSAVLPQVAAGVLVAALSWLAAQFVGALVMRLQPRVDDHHKDLIEFLADLVGWTLFGIGVIAGLGTAGVDVTALVTGLGLAGFALGLATKDILANMVAGLMVLLFRPYTRGDRVRIDTFQGKVSDIDLRYTTLLAKGGTILVPNAKAYTEVVILLNDEPAASEPEEAPKT